VVKTLQQHIDATFGSIKRTRVRTPPDPQVLDRERAFQNQASKLENLRLRRMANEQLVYEVVRHRGHWRILHLEKYSKPFEDEAAAIDAAKQTAKDRAKRGHPVEVILRQTDGQSVTCALDEER
jgi:hypothetical protein